MNKVNQIESINKKGQRATEYRITFWDDSGDYASFVAFVGYKIYAKDLARLAKKALSKLGIIPAKCKTTIEKTF